MLLFFGAAKKSKSKIINTVNLKSVIKLKKKILEMLKNAGANFVSGENIAEIMNVSRTAIWKHVQSLRKRGYQISSSERLGYKLDKIPDLLLPEIVQSELDTKIIGVNYIYKNSVKSTNELAKKLAYDGAASGTVIVAEEQTGGKGRFERNFFSPKEKGIWFSVILRPQCMAKDAPKFTLMAAVALARAMERFNLHAEIKWPNDIIFDGRKLVGILTEMSAEIGHINYIVVGIGINVNISRAEFPESIREIAASLSEMAGENLSRTKFFRAVLEEFDKLYTTKNFDEVFKLWRKYNNTLGKKVTVLSAETGDIFTGMAVDIDADGALIVDTDNGRKIVYAGDVSIRPAN